MDFSMEQTLYTSMCTTSSPSLNKRRHQPETSLTRRRSERFVVFSAFIFLLQAAMAGSTVADMLENKTLGFCQRVRGPLHSWTVNKHGALDSLQFAVYSDAAWT